MMTGNLTEKQAPDPSIQLEASPDLASNEELAFTVKRRRLSEGEEAVKTETAIDFKEPEG